MLTESRRRLNGLKKDRDERIKFLKEICCIAFGTIVGLVTYVACLYFKLAIFGWNFGLVLAPLFAGYAESQVAKIFLDESTGAVSAFILFIITVVYGFILKNPTLGFNVITAGSIVLIVQAAFPLAVNYFLLAMFLAIISHIEGVFRRINRFVYNLYVDLFHKEPKIAVKVKEKQMSRNIEFYDMELDMNSLGVLPPKELNIIEMKGVYEARHIFSSKQKEEIRDGLGDTLEENKLMGVKLARDKAMLKLIKELKADGCNGILNLHTTYETLGPSQGENVDQVVMKGTGIIYEEEEEEEF